MFCFIFSLKLTQRQFKNKSRGMEFSFSYWPPYILFCFYLMDARTGSACQSGVREDRARQLSSVTHSCFAHALGLLAIRHVPSRNYNPLFSFGLCIHRITASSHCGHSCSLRFELKAGSTQKLLVSLWCKTLE